MSVSNHPKAYGTAAVAAAFVVGVLVTLGLKDIYPDLELRFQRRERRSEPEYTVITDVSASHLPQVRLEDHTRGDRRSMAPTMPPIPEGVEGLIGNTPLFKIKSLSAATGRNIYAKAEFLNGAGNSPKDRVALHMIRMAEEEGLLTPGRGDTIYEGTVGSTGISLATLARALGYKAHICMPDDQSAEKSELLHHLGAEVERVTPAPITSPQHFVNLARTRAAQHTAAQGVAGRGFFADQFETRANYTAHYATTGPEIYAQTGGLLDAFVAGAGTGGTISGVGLYLKERLGPVGRPFKLVLADPPGSGLYNKIRYGVMYAATEREGTRRRQQVDTIVEGIGINRLTANLEAGRELIDEAVRVSDPQALAMAHWLVVHDGLFVGSSSAVNCVAAVITALTLPPGSQVVTLLCDSGTRHLSKFWRVVGELQESQEEEEVQDLLTVLGITGDGDQICGLKPAGDNHTAP